MLRTASLLLLLLLTACAGPGSASDAGIGPFHLLEESEVNHLGKLGFKWIYWNLLVKGEPLPITSHMSSAGKWRHGHV